MIHWPSLQVKEQRITLSTACTMTKGAAIPVMILSVQRPRSPRTATQPPRSPPASPCVCRPQPSTAWSTSPAKYLIQVPQPSQVPPPSTAWSTSPGAGDCWWPPPTSRRGTPCWWTRPPASGRTITPDQATRALSAHVYKYQIYTDIYYCLRSIPVPSDRVTE